MTAKSKKSVEPRRANKPLMEKRRRARINQSLLALKSLILDSAKSENTKHTKLEKADILELTVRHFQRHRSLDTPGVRQYRAGYSDCVKEVQRYLETPDAQTMTVIDAGIRQRLIHHLENCVSEVDLDLRPPNVEERLQPPDSSTVEEINNNKHLEGKSVPSRVVINPSTLPHIENHQEGNVFHSFSTSTTAKPKPSMSSLSDVGPKSSDGYDLKELPSKVIKTNDGNFIFVLPSHYLQLANALGINVKDYRNECQKLLADVSGKCEPEKPLDFSKNNENENMWRPW